MTRSVEDQESGVDDVLEEMELLLSNDFNSPLQLLFQLHSILPPRS